MAEADHAAVVVAAAGRIDDRGNRTNATGSNRLYRMGK